MQIETFSYGFDSGWDVSNFPALDSDKTLVIVFAAPEFRDKREPIQELIDAFPNSHIVGCSTAGEIRGGCLHDQTLTVACCRFDSTELKVARANIEAPTKSYDAAAEICAQLMADDLKALFVLSEGLQVNGSELARGFSENLPAGVVVTGGLAADGSRFGETFVIQQSVTYHGAVCAVGLYGDSIRVGHGSKGGWDKFGHERTVTRSDGNILYELDGMPALDIYKKYLGDKAKELPASGLLFPLSIRSRLNNDKPLVRTILGVNDEDNSMIFAGDIPQGSFAQFLFANFDRLIGGSAEAALSSCEDEFDQVLAIAISCVGRRLVLGDRTEEEIEAALEVLPPQTQLIGFYSYGELSPFASGVCDLHNQSMTLTTFREAA